MADIKTPEARSINMSHIRNRDTKSEIYFRKLLFKDGYRYRTNVKGIDGHPDIFLAKHNTAIFVNGCFWHRHEGCKYAYMPKSRIEFWSDKFDKNVKRDRQVRDALSRAGIKCLVIWECTIKEMRKDLNFQDTILMRTEEFIINQDQKFLEL